jgi:hypothetical protein
MPNPSALANPVVLAYCVIVLDEKGHATLERVVFDSFVESQAFAGTKLQAGYCVSLYPFAREANGPKD